MSKLALYLHFNKPSAQKYPTQTVRNHWVALNPLCFLSSFVPLKGFLILFSLPAERFLLFYIWTTSINTSWQSCCAHCTATRRRSTLSNPSPPNLWNRISTHIQLSLPFFYTKSQQTDTKVARVRGAFCERINKPQS